MDKGPKKIEVVSGNKNDLEISDVLSYLNVAKPKIKNDKEKKEEIIVPKSNKDKKES